MSKNLYVGNLSFQTTADDLREAFGQHGTVTTAQVIADRDTGRSRGFAFVEMADGAEQAIENLNGTELQGRTLTVNEARPREERPRFGGDRAGAKSGGYGRRF
jgi:RNA recognition motif-containing protein